MFTDSIVDQQFGQIEEDSIRVIVKESMNIPKLDISHETSQTYKTHKSNLPNESMYILHRERYKSYIDVDQTCLGVHKSRYRKFNLK